MFAYLLIGAAVFGLCFLADKGFTKAFRGKPQHQSGKAVRMNRHVGGAGIVLTVLGLLGLISSHGWLVKLAGGILIAVGLGLAVYYLSFGIYYDADSFLLNTLGRKSAAYPYRSIRGQQLYISGGRTVLELHMDDGRTLQLPLHTKDSEAFLDTAFAGYCAQRGLSREDCPWHDPERSCWFPKMED